MIDQVRARLASIESRFGMRAETPPPAPTQVVGSPADFATLLAQHQRPLDRSLGFSGGTRIGSVPMSPSQADRASRFSHDFEAAGARHRIDPALLSAVAWAESDFDPSAVSHAGALGLMQLMPGTAESLGVDPLNPAQAIDGAARYLREQLDRFGSLPLALAAYNAGPGAVESHGGIPPYPETTAYVAKVTGRLETLRSQQWT